MYFEYGFCLMHLWYIHIKLDLNVSKCEIPESKNEFLNRPGLPPGLWSDTEVDHQIYTEIDCQVLDPRMSRSQ